MYTDKTSIPCVSKSENMHRLNNSSTFTLTRNLSCIPSILCFEHIKASIRIQELLNSRNPPYYRGVCNREFALSSAHITLDYWIQLQFFKQGLKNLELGQAAL